MLRINQISRLLGSISGTASSLYIISLLREDEVNFASYVVLNSCIALVSIIQMGIFNVINHNLTTWFASEGVDFLGGVIYTFKKIRYKLILVLLAFMSLLIYKHLFVWWVLFLPLVVYIKQSIQTVEQSSFTDYRYWLREMVMSCVKILLLFNLKAQGDVSYLNVFAVLIIVDVVFVLTYLTECRKVPMDVQIDLEHRSTYRFAFLSNFLSNQAESVFPIFFLSPSQVLIWGVLMPFVSISKQLSSSLMGANFAYVQTKNAPGRYLKHMLFMLILLDMIGLLLSVLWKPYVVEIFGEYVEAYYIEIVVLSILYFSIFMLNMIFGDWLRKLGNMAFINYTSIVGIFYTIGFVILWTINVFTDIHIYFIGKLCAALLMVMITIHEFRKILYR